MVGGSGKHHRSHRKTTTMSAPSQLAAQPDQTVEDVAGQFTPRTPEHDTQTTQERNHRNAILAAKGLAVSTDADENPTRMSDMIANMWHLADLLGVDMDEVLANGARYYEEEVHETTF